MNEKKGLTAEKALEKKESRKDQYQRWISVYLGMNVQGHKSKLRGLTGETWYIGKRKPLSVVELCLQIIRRVCFFAQDTGFISPGPDWVSIYRQLSDATRSIAQYYEDNQIKKHEGG